ncbi:UDP-glucuronate 4-epimerase [Seinonella peptonophila]|uniref:UDP-glucuronate 4-epimerase n=1 Tax=Seinonella peptonophila TaxID=112248 RepID=A0A1M4YLK9_9BACL|nr:NAD-dependent epimerase/dehydratase family protein [Seinonella peptonophila]SHF06517.1 UDP-glucuronate 4-epimerase [Seinonella peptonophila]
MKILLTGGAGFIGSHLVRHFLQGSTVEKIAVIDNLDAYYSPKQKQERLEQWQDEPRVVCYRSDICQREQIKQVFQQEQWEVIIHLAAIPGVRPSLQRPTEYVDIDVTGTVQLLQLAVEYQVPHLIFFSSSSVYGHQSVVQPWKEGITQEMPSSPYAAAKRSAEIFCQTYQQLYPLHVTILRPFTVYGPEQRPDMAIHFFARQMVKGLPIPVFSLDSSRDYTYIDDLIQAVERCLMRPNGFQLFNVASGERISLRQMIKQLASALHVEAKLEIKGEQLGDPAYTWADLTQIKETIGYRPQVDFATGIQRFATWFQQNRTIHDFTTDKKV